MKKTLFVLASVLMMAGAFTCDAQKTVTFDDVYRSRTPQPRQKTPMYSWGADGNTFTEIQPGAPAARPAAPAGPAVRGTLSPDGSKSLVTTGSKRVWRQNTKCDYSVMTVADGTMRPLGKGFEPTELMFAKFAPSSDAVAYVYKNNIYLEDFANGKIRPLTTDGSDTIVNGTSDWVYEEELSLRDCFRWSPDGKYIAFWQFDTEGTGTFYMIDNVDSVYSRPIPLPYPKAGTTNSAVKVGVITVADGTIRWFDLPGDPRNNYIARMDFVPESNMVMIQQLNRLQNHNSVWYGNVEDMSLDMFYEDSDAAFLNVNDGIIWLDKGKYFTWRSEKDGWRHLYKVARDGKSEICITKGDFDVISTLKFDTKGGYLYFYATPEDDAVHTYLYRSRLDGKKPAERLTPASYAGNNRYSLSADCRKAVHTFTNCTTPSVYELVSLPDHKVIKVLEDNAEYKAAMAEYGFPDKEYFKVDIGEVILDAWMMKPKNFDPSRKYPVIFHIYGEPASSTVSDGWSSPVSWNNLLNEQGYVVMSVDPRGTNNPRGREWRKSVYGKVGILPMQDHAAAVLKIEEMFPWVDASRIGVWGWSGGGSSTANLLFKYPDIYKTGIAVAGVYNQLCYDTIYQERYMGLPSENPDGYFYGSPMNSAAGLKGNLLIIHGTGDDNVHYQCAEMLINELIKHGKKFSMMAYPMRTHGISEGAGTTVHLYSTMFDYWLNNL